METTGSEASSHTPVETDSKPARRDMCLRCQLAVSVCWCAHLPSIESNAQLVFLQHPREARKAIGTARMAHLGIPGSRLHVGLAFDGAAILQAPAPHQRTVVLYPTPESEDISTLQHTPEEGLTIVVLDGTWFQARKLWQHNPWLHALPAYRIEPKSPGRYRIRREPKPHCLSTVEAVVALLDVLQGNPETNAGLLRPFDAMVDRQVAFVAHDRTPRRRTRPHAAAAPTPASAVLNTPHLLLVNGEGSGWHANAAERTELIQWEAIRPATGERFHAFLRPSRPLAPNALEHLQLVEPELTQHALSRAAFCEAWAHFVRSDDVWCAWGYFPVKLFNDATEGPSLERLDLREIVRTRAGKRLGSVEAAHALLECVLTEPWGPGRATRRLAQMVSVVEKLRQAPTREES